MMNTPITDWQGLRVWVVGASSGIGAAVAEKLVAAGARVAMSARSADKLQALVENHPRQLLALPLDVTDRQAWQAATQRLRDEWGGFDLVMFVAGDYRPLQAWELEAETAADMVNTNVIGVTNGLAAVLPQLLRQGRGGVALVASVAGYRGLPKALIYGPTKAALINLAEGLYLDLAPRGLGVYLINPGFVRTQLTARNDFDMPALQTPEQAAAAILRGIERGRFEIAFPRRLALPLKLLRLLPYRLYFLLIHKVTGL